jgi:hypothetical protein
MIVAEWPKFVQLRARAPELRKRNEKKARKAENTFLLYTVSIMLS